MLERNTLTVLLEYPLFKLKMENIILNSNKVSMKNNSKNEMNRVTKTLILNRNL